MYFTTRAFWVDLAERVASTAAAGAIAVVSAASFGLFEIDSWQAVAGAAGVAGLMSFLKAFALGRPGSSTPGTDEPAQLVDEASAPAERRVASAGGVTSVYPPQGR